MGFLWGPWIYALTQHLLVADSVTPGTFYVDLTAGGFWKSTDGGVTWTQESATNAPGYPHHGTMAAVPGVSGDLWMVDGHEGGTAHGLFHTLDGGNTFTRSSVFDYAWVLALGKTAPGKSYPAIYVDGLYHGDPNWGIFQSIDGGVTFNRIANYPYGILDIPNAMTASWDVFGEVYIGFEGNTFYYAVYNDTTDPLTPPTLSATAGLNVVNLSWEPGAGGTPTGYNLYRGTASGQESTTPIATFDGSTFAYADTNVTDGTTYYYTLEATSTNGQSPVTSNEVSATPLIPLPGAPTGLTASIGGPSQINLTWIAPSGTVTSYNIYRSTTSGGEGTVPLQSGVTALTFADTSVLPGVQYYYTVAAVNSTGVGAQSAEATIALTQAAIPTFSPGSTSFTGTQSVSIATTTVNAGIIYTTDGSTPSTTHGSKYSGPITLTNTTTINAIAYGAGYTTSAVGTATYTLIVLEPAIVLTAVAASNSEIDLSWSIPAGVTVPAYYVFRGTSAGGESATPLATVTAATTYQDKSVSSGATYYYIVTAVNGAVPNSNEASATATQPALSFASGSGNTTASVTAGDTAVFNLTLDSTNYTGTVTYTCTGAPAGDVCSVVPAPLNLTPATTTSQVVITVKTAAKTAMLESQSTVYLSMVTWTGLLLSLPLWIKRRRLGMIAILLLTSGVLFAVSGCGSSTKPAATTSTLTLTAIGTGGVAPASATLTLTVQQPNTF
jgi:fibronectin type 3 domain-containing protein